MRSSSALALALVATLAVAPSAMAQDGQSGGASQLPPECQMLGPKLDQETISQIKGLDAQHQALSCMIGTPREYEAALSARQPGGAVEIVDVEKAWGSDAVAKGLAQSAAANAEATEDLQIALQSDTELSQFIERSGYLVDNVFAVAVRGDGSMTLFVAPGLTRADMTATGSIGGKAGD